MDNRAFLAGGAAQGVSGSVILAGVCETGVSGLASRPRSARRSASLFPSTVTCEGTLTQMISLSG